MAEKELVFPDPDPDDVPRLAYQLLGKKSRLDMEVLDNLVGQPRRYTELRDALIQGRTDTPLTRALQRLQRDGLIRRRSDVSQSPPIDRYELTDLGADVLFTVHNFRFVSGLHAQARKEISDVAGA